MKAADDNFDDMASQSALAALLDMMCIGAKAPAEFRGKWIITNNSGVTMVGFVNDDGQYFIHYDDMFGYTDPDQIPFIEHPNQPEGFRTIV